MLPLLLSEIYNSTCSSCITQMSVKRGLTGTALTFSLTSTRLIRTPRYYRQFFALSLGKARTFSLNSTRLIRTPR